MALEAVKEEKIIAELAGHYEVHPTQVKAWKQHVLAHVEELFMDKRRKKKQEHEYGLFLYSSPCLTIQSLLPQIPVVLKKPEESKKL